MGARPSGATPSQAWGRRMRAQRYEAPHATTVGQLAEETDEVANGDVPRVQPVFLSPPSINMAMIYNHLSFSDILETLLLAAPNYNLARIRVFTTYANRSPASSTSSTPRSSSSSSPGSKSESILLYVL